MAGPGTSFGSPLLCGTTPANMGEVVCSQSLPIGQAGATAVSATFAVPQGSQLTDIIVDPLTAWNSATSAVLTVGTVAAGTQFSSAIDVKAAAARTLPTYTAAQLTAMSAVAGGNIVATVTPTGATSAGNTLVTIKYVPQAFQNDSNF
jgi:hypothetical protein